MNVGAVTTEETPEEWSSSHSNILMNLRAILSDIWADPVWSKVIAAAIVTAAGSVWLAAKGLPWIQRRRASKTLVFVSSGSTCRDPMAMAITRKLLEKKKLKHRISIRAVGLGPINDSEASYAARFVIEKMYGKDLLAKHKPEQLTEELLRKSDLVLVMDKSLLQATNTSPSGWPDAYKGKTFLLKEFFGMKGDVVDPWTMPDAKDDVTLSRYRMCAKELREILEKNLDKLIQRLDL